jgi:effector-binding domain-containing protein
MPGYEITVEQVPEMHGISMRHVLAGTSEIPPFLTDAFAAISHGGIVPAGPPLTIYHDPEYDPKAIDTEVFIPVAPGVHGPVPTAAGRELTDRTVETMEVASLVHTGPYDTLGEAYGAMQTWMGEHGYEAAGPPQEIYLSGPDEPGPPVTEIRWPVTKA